MLSAKPVNQKLLPVSRLEPLQFYSGKLRTPKSVLQYFSHGERAELASDEWIPLSSVLEGFVILKKNPNSIDAPKDKK